ncbi:MAG: hypothetical protein U0790_26495 [Isosphaeraceae bacterium]
MLPPPKPPPLNPTRAVGENGRIREPSSAQERLADHRPALAQLRAAQQRQGDFLAERHRAGDDRLGHDPGIGRVQPQRGVEIEHEAEPGRGRQDGALGRLDVRLALVQLGAGPMGVGLAPLAGRGVGGGQLGDAPCLVPHLEGDGAAALGAEQFAVGRRRGE